MENNEEIKTTETQKTPEKKENTMPAIVSYLWWIGWIISFAALYKDNKTEFNAYHIRQSFGVHLASVAMIIIGMVLSHIPFGGLIEWGLRVLILVLLVMGIISASQGEKKPLPVVGEAFQNWFKGLVK